MKDTMGMWQPAPDTGATYSMWDATEIEKIWVTKNAKGASAKDDVQFEYFGDPTDFQVKGCMIRGKSRSQNINWYQDGVQYCNLWNVLNELKDPSGTRSLDGTQIVLDDCKWAPKDPATTCKKK